MYPNQTLLIMSNSSTPHLPIKTLQEKLQQKEFSAVELTQYYLDQIKERDDKLNCYIDLYQDLALEMAHEADQKRAQGQRHPLLGIPLGIKDCFAIEDQQTRSASKILEGYHSPYEGPAIERLRQAGAVFLGKTNTDEFTCGASTENSAYGPTRNPHDPQRVAGGSSGGSAAAVAAGLCAASMGTDTGGSIRQPAGFCGVVGLKNTYGRVPRYGVIPMASSLDTIGALTQTVEDMAIMLQTIAGQHPSDATTAPIKVPDYQKLLNQLSLSDITIGIPKEYFIDGLEKEVEKDVQKAIDLLEKKGATLKSISLPHTRYAIPTYYIIAPSEVSSNMARFDGIRYGPGSKKADSIEDHYLQVRSQGFGPEVKRRIMIGTHVLSSGYYDAYYLKAQKVRTLIGQDFEKAFMEVDVIAAPTSPSVAFKIGQNIDDPLQMYLADVLTAPINLAGNPSLSLPCTKMTPQNPPSSKLPIGLQLIGPHFREDLLLQVGHIYEKEQA